ncbi:MAG: hypothetical protein LLG09_02745 [Negativicutes bacterium]|nr:hypothetical protein [Negativicutes bacterium]
MRFTTVAMADFTPVLVTRKIGKAVKDLLAVNLQASGEPEVLILDFREIQILDFSCADECIAKLLIEICGDFFGPKALLLSNLSEDQLENVAAALSQRNLVICYLSGGQLRILGELKEPLAATLDVLNQNKTVTAREIADLMQIAINTASNRLSELSKRGLSLRRNDMPAAGGKQYLYCSILPDQAELRTENQKE